MHRRSTALLTTLLALSAASVAHAQADSAGTAGGFGTAASAGSSDTDVQNRRAAAEAYDTGTARYLRRDFANAANWFETADRLAPSPAALQSAIRAHRDAGTPDHLARAATLSLRLLSRYPGDARLEAAAQRVLQQIAPQFARLNVRCGSCEVEVDQVLQSSSEFFVAPGQHSLVAHWSQNRTVTRQVEALAGSIETITLEEPAARCANPPCDNQPPRCEGDDCDEPPPRPSSVRVVPVPVFVTAAVVTAGVLGAAAGVWWGLTVPAAQDLLDDADRTHMRNRQSEMNVASLETASTALVTTGVILAAGTALTGIIFTRWSPPPRAPRASMLIGPPGAIGLSLDGRF